MPTLPIPDRPSIETISLCALVFLQFSIAVQDGGCEPPIHIKSTVLYTYTQLQQDETLVEVMKRTGLFFMLHPLSPCCTLVRGPTLTGDREWYRVEFDASDST